MENCNNDVINNIINKCNNASKFILLKTSSKFSKFIKNTYVLNLEDAIESQSISYVEYLKESKRYLDILPNYRDIFNTGNPDFVKHLITEPFCYAVFYDNIQAIFDNYDEKTIMYLFYQSAGIFTMSGFLTNTDMYKKIIEYKNKSIQLFHEHSRHPDKFIAKILKNIQQNYYGSMENHKYLSSKGYVQKISQLSYYFLRYKCELTIEYVEYLFSTFSHQEIVKALVDFNWDNTDPSIVVWLYERNYITCPNIDKFFLFSGHTDIIPSVVDYNTILYCSSKGNFSNIDTLEKENLSQYRRYTLCHHFITHNRKELCDAFLYSEEKEQFKIMYEVGGWNAVHDSLDLFSCNGSDSIKFVCKYLKELVDQNKKDYIITTYKLASIDSYFAPDIAEGMKKYKGCQNVIDVITELVDGCRIFYDRGNGIVHLCEYICEAEDFAYLSHVLTKCKIIEDFWRITNILFKKGSYEMVVHFIKETASIKHMYHPQFINQRMAPSVYFPGILNLALRYRDLKTVKYLLTIGMKFSQDSIMYAFFNSEHTAAWLINQKEYNFSIRDVQCRNPLEGIVTCDNNDNEIWACNKWEQEYINNFRRWLIKESKK